MTRVPLIHHPVAVEYFFREGGYITEAWNGAVDEAVSIARARVLPGVTTRWHRLRGVTERYLILEGQGCVEIGEEPPAKVGPGPPLPAVPSAVAFRLCSPSWRRWNQWLPIAIHAHLNALAPCEPLAPLLPVKSLSMSSWPHPLKSWSLRESRGGSDHPGGECKSGRR